VSNETVLVGFGLEVVGKGEARRTLSPEAGRGVVLLLEDVVPSVSPSTNEKPDYPNNGY